MEHATLRRFMLIVIGLLALPVLLSNLYALSPYAQQQARQAACQARGPLVPALAPPWPAQTDAATRRQFCTAVLDWQSAASTATQLPALSQMQKLFATSTDPEARSVMALAIGRAYQTQSPSIANGWFREAVGNAPTPVEQLDALLDVIDLIQPWLHARQAQPWQQQAAALAAELANRREMILLFEALAQTDAKIGQNQNALAQLHRAWQSVTPALWQDAANPAGDGHLAEAWRQRIQSEIDHLQGARAGNAATAGIFFGSHCPTAARSNSGRLSVRATG